VIMYHPRIIEKRLNAAAQNLKMEFEYHSIKQVDDANSHFKELVNPETGEPKRELDAEEKKWIRNEHTLCMCDYSYYATHYAFITDWTNRCIRFTPNIAQQIKMDIRSEMEGLGQSIEMMSLKARQLGISTEDEIAAAHRVQFYSYVGAVIGSCDPTKSAKMSKMMETNWDNQPFFLLPEMTVRKEGQLFEFGYQHSSVSIQHGSQFTGIARGSTSTVVHLCLNKKTLIRVEDGRVIPIEEIRDGQSTIGKNGRVIKINRICKSKRSNELTAEIQVWGTPTTLSCTRDHLVLTKRGWIPAHRITDNDWILYPVRPLTNKKKTIPIMMYGRYKRVGSQYGKLQEFPTSFALGRLCGFYLAEGSIDSSVSGNPKSVLFSINADEDERTRQWIKEAFPAESNGRLTNRRKNSKSAVLPFGCKGFADFLLQNFGEKDSKRIPDWAWDCDKEFAEGLVFGYLMGDGHFAARDNAIYATSIRSAILFGLRELIVSLGYGWSQISYRESGIYYNRNCKAVWILNIAGETAKNYRERNHQTLFTTNQGTGHWETYGNYIALSVLSNSDGLAESFYDLEVDDKDHAFLSACGIVHNSELSSFEDPEDSVDASLLRAVHPSVWVLMDFESTAMGRHNWWHRTWIYSKENWESGRARLRPVFLPWFVGKDIYPTATEMRTHPVPKDWQPPSIVIKHAEKAEAYVKANKLLRKYLGENWKMPIEQMWFWEKTRAEYAAKKELGKFYQEMCSNDLEAFQADTTSVFDVDVISAYRECARDPKGVYGIIGNQSEIPLRMHPERRDIDSNKPIIEVSCNWTQRGKPQTFDLVPLKFEGYSHFDPMGKLLIYEWPEEGELYGLGVDTADGLGLDRTVVEVCRKGSLLKNDQQSAEWVSPFVNAYDLWPICMAMGTLYSTMVNGSLRQAKQVIECKGNGENVQLELRKRGWRNFHQWMRYDNKRLNQNSSNKFGWFTNSWSRDMLMDMLIKALRDGWLDIFSPYFADEMADLQRDENRQSLRALYGGFDDRIMAMGMIYISLHILEVRGKQKSIFEQRLEYKNQQGQYPKYDVGPQGRDLELEKPGRRDIRLSSIR
jgi:hypothetical protein